MLSLDKLEIKLYGSTSPNYHLSKRLLEKFHLSSDINQKERETLFIEHICNNVKKSKSVLYVLSLDGQNLGLIASSVTSVSDYPCIQIDFIFTDKRYRGKKIKELDNLKVSEFLIDLIITEAREIKQKVGLKYLILLLDNEELIPLYKDLGFNIFRNKRNKNNYMYLSV